MLTYTITDKHLKVHSTGLAPAPAHAHAPAQAHAHAPAHSTLITRSQKLVVRHHERHKAIRRHDKE